MGNYIKKHNKNFKEDEENKKIIKNLLNDYMNVINKSNSNNHKSCVWTDSPFPYVKSKNILKPNETIFLGLEFISQIFSQVDVKEVNINLLQAGFIPKFCEGSDLTNDNEGVQFLKALIKAWIDNDSNQANYAVLKNIGELLPKPEDMPIFSEEISSINAKDSNNINTLSENGSYVEDDLISNSQLRNKKNERLLNKKGNFNKKVPINKKLTFNVFPQSQGSPFDKNRLTKSSTKAFPLLNFLNANKFKKEKVSEHSSNIVSRERIDTDKNNNIANANINEIKKTPNANDSKKTSNNNLGSSIIQLKSLNSDIRTPPIISPPSLNNKNESKSPIIVKESISDIKKKFYNRRITEQWEEGEDDNSKPKESQTLNKQFGFNKKKAMSLEKKIDIIAEYGKGEGAKTTNLKNIKHSKKVDTISPMMLKGSTKGKSLKYNSSKMNKFTLNENKKNTDLAEKELSNSDRVKTKNKSSKTFVKRQFTKNEEFLEKKNIKYLRIDIRQLENEDKTTEESNSLPRPFNFEMMHLDQNWAAKNYQRSKRSDMENIFRSVSKSPHHKNSNDMENLKSNILSTINHIQNSKKDFLNNSDDEDDDLGINEINTITKSKFNLKSPNLFKNIVKNAMNSSSKNSFSKNNLIIEFPKYQIDVSPLKLGDLPVNEVLKLLKTKNKFLFEETKEEKDLTSKIQKLTLETIEDN